MNDKELNIKSSTVEKGLDLAKDFLGKLITPSIEELGLVLSDNIKYFRFKNQVKILLKAKNITEKNNINIKQIPIKLLVPLLENASLEEDDKLQDKWAVLLANMVDSEQNTQNHIFPYILSQISLEEYTELHLIKKNEDDFKIKQLRHQILIEKEGRNNHSDEFKELNTLIKKIKQDGFKLILEKFELANLERLGLIRMLPPKIQIDDRKRYTGRIVFGAFNQIKAEYISDEFKYRITELGIKFIEALNTKTK
jgi:hypothetical protein